MNVTTPRTVLSLSAFALLVTGAMLHAGPLNPPVGPVAPTAKPLAEVEPRVAINATNTPGDADSLFKITAPGSYYLTGNITGVAGKHGVEIASGGVTLDLHGFDLVGAAGGAGVFDGVRVTAAGAGGIAVFNGSVRNWTGAGVDLASAGTLACRVQDVLSYVNGGSGIVTGRGTTVTNCSASLNGNAGIVLGLGCTVTNCSATSNGGSGIEAGAGSTVSGCSATSNTVYGISVSSGCTVADCTVMASTLDGIVCLSACVIRGNTCWFNGNNSDGAGVHATGGGNRIEGNTCTSADRGIGVDAAGNIIIRNTCSGNTLDWDIVANNIYGPIIDRRVPASAAVSGFTAASTLGSTEPNANFSY